MQGFLKLVSLLLLVGMLAACSSSADQSNSQVSQAAEINVKLGLGYLQQGNVPLAKEKLLLALQQDANSTAANSAMAYFLERTGDNAGAEQYYQKAISVADVKGGPQNNYGTFLCRQGRYQDAENYFGQAAKDPNYTNTDQVYENAGLCAMLNSDSDAAQGYFRKALKINPHLTTAIFQLAMIQYDLANYDQASDYMKQYDAANGPQTAEALWLQIRLAQRASDMKTVYTLGDQLRINYATSKQYREYQQLRASLQ